MTANAEDHQWRPEDLELCFEGAVPAVVATADASGVPNVTFLSRVRKVDDERVALSNQFFSKTARNLAENPRASLLLMDPTDFRQFRLALAYERTEKQGRVFERLREDVDAVAAMQGMQDVFRLRAADIYRVLQIDLVPEAVFSEPQRETNSGSREAEFAEGTEAATLATLATRLGRCSDLDTLVSAAVDGLAELFGFGYSLLMLLDEEGTRLYTIASHGYEAQGIGSETAVGEGIIGMAAARGVPMRLGNLNQIAKYGRTVRKEYERGGALGPGREVPMPGLVGAKSRVAVPTMALGQLVGVLVVDSPDEVAFTDADEALLTVAASIVGSAIEIERTRARVADSAPSRLPDTAPLLASTPSTRIRHYAIDGSTFIDGDYLIKGVAGRLLWSLLRQYESEGRVEFTNKEVRLDPSLELPEFRNNFESRLVLLKRRLDERLGPIRIEKTGRGRFRLEIGGNLRLEASG